MTSRIEPPKGDEIHVWRVALDGGGRAAARAALGELLAGYLGAETTASAPDPGGVPWPAGAPALSIDGGGKPRLAQGPERLSFNLSHSGELALIAIAAGGVEVGIDVERVRPRRDPARLAARWLPEADAEAVAGAGEAERDEIFHAAWTRHEARVKCTGAGLSGPPPGDEIVARQLDVGPRYTAAVAFDLDAAGGHEPRITLRER
ncbi:MAG: 4'-phosphopantetheinyl transferase superfamily protein [Actinobacteria bacterium]|nr:4'-phosphopantetheinyl transferase superfamily protein [Actinomycetota bacterium]